MQTLHANINMEKFDRIIAVLQFKFHEHTIHFALKINYYLVYPAQVLILCTQLLVGLQQLRHLLR